MKIQFDKNKHKNEKDKFKPIDYQMHQNKIMLRKFSLETKLEKSKNSDYRLYGGMRATLIFSPNCGLPNNEELDKLCLDLQPMMYTQLWCKWEPINIPASSNLINVIGLRYFRVRPIFQWPGQKTKNNDKLKYAVSSR